VPPLEIINTIPTVSTWWDEYVVPGEVFHIRTLAAADIDALHYLYGYRIQVPQVFHSIEEAATLFARNSDGTKEVLVSTPHTDGSAITIPSTCRITNLQSLALTIRFGLRKTYGWIAHWPQHSKLMGV
jgi:hypothetical protein